MYKRVLTITIDSYKRLADFHCISSSVFFIVLICTLMHVSPGYCVDISQPPQQNNILRVGVIPFDPFVITGDGEQKGISIELWEEVARINHWQYKYTFLPESGYLDIEPLLKAKKLDVIIGPIAITYHRMSDISFTIPYFISTSNVITRDIQSSFGKLLLHFVKEVFRLPLAVLLLTVLICSFLIWLKERHNFPNNFPQSFSKGIPYSIWYGFHTIFSVDIFFEIKDTFSRILTVIMLICSLALVSIAVASITSALTLSHSGSTSKIGALEDLRDQPVAIIAGTDVKGFLQNLDVNVVLEGSLPEAFSALDHGDAVAIITDKLLVMNYLKKHKVSKVHITDLVIRSNIMSFALQKDSPLRGPINDAIVSLQNKDWIYRMCLRYLSRRDAAFCTL
jgi:polar amino acid transport system substrate-binding protein